MSPEKIFKGFRFYFHPSRTLSRVNGVKAAASARFGAKIENSPSPSTTHILVDNDNVSHQFWELLDNSKIRETCEILSIDWPSRCIEQQKLVNTDTFRIEMKAASPEQDDNAGKSSADSAKNQDIKNGNRDTNVKYKSVKDESVKDEDISDDSISNDSISDDNICSDGISGEEEKDIKITNRKRSHCIGSSDVPHKSRRASNTRKSSPSNSFSSSSKDSTTVSTAGHPKNRILIDTFHELLISREAAGEQFSSRAYRQALETLENTPKPIYTVGDALQLPHFGKHMAELVRDIRRGKFPAELTRSTREKSHVLQLFSTVYGVGPHKAKKLYDQGCRSLKDIEDKVDDNGRISIEHHEDLVERMSRTEVDKHYQAVKDLVLTVDPELHVKCMGSYRRGQLDCGDIDIILTKPDVDMRGLNKSMRRLLSLMFKTGLAKYTFSKGEDRWYGATDIIGKWRRLDILLVPWSQLGAAMIYYTGNDLFNRQLRLEAKRQNMLLSHNGLYKRKSGDSTELIESHDERKIFEILGIPWREPYERIIT